MSYTDPIESLKKLANGIDPKTGKVFDPREMHKHAELSDELERIARLLRVEMMKYRKATGGRAKVNTAWSAEEVRQAVDSYESGEFIEDIGSRHERNAQGIKSKLKAGGKFKNR